jgi:adenine deaminase
MRLGHVDVDDMVLRLDVPDGIHRVRTIADPVMTHWDHADVEVRDGVVQLPPGHLMQVTIHRHGRVPATPHAAVLAGWGEWAGAVATTVAHDTHNLVVFGCDPADMAEAANAVIATSGGVAVVRDGAVVASMALPIAGLLAPGPAAEVAAAQREVQDAAVALGGIFTPMLTQPLFQMMLSSLACLPGPHITDVGLIDGTSGELVASMRA